MLDELIKKLQSRDEEEIKKIFSIESGNEVVDGCLKAFEQSIVMDYDESGLVKLYFSPLVLAERLKRLRARLISENIEEYALDVAKDALSDFEEKAGRRELLNILEEYQENKNKK